MKKETGRTQSNPLSRRAWGLSIASHAFSMGALLGGCSFLGCTGADSPNLDARSIKLTYGRRGYSDGRFLKPRAMVIDKQDNVYAVDTTGRIQVFGPDGSFLRSWSTPEMAQGKPTGLGITKEGLIMVADTHYFRVLFYSPEGELLQDKTLGGISGGEPGQFAWVTDVVQDSIGNYFISEYGEFDRIHKYSSDGQFICHFGKLGDGELEFSRPQSMAIDDDDHLWIVDSHNHRIQVVACPHDQPTLLKSFGSQGTEPGQFKYPYGIFLDHTGNLLISEIGNHRIQRLDRNGKCLAMWGSCGRLPGQLDSPWGVVEDSKHLIHVLDSKNHRIQCIKL